jgi:hypothetical protein
MQVCFEIGTALGSASTEHASSELNIGEKGFFFFASPGVHRARSTWTVAPLVQHCTWEPIGQ